jgi:hypothetical protein
MEENQNVSTELRNEDTQIGGIITHNYVCCFLEITADNYYKLR